jgi:hypothetical protein
MQLYLALCIMQLQHLQALFAAPMAVNMAHTLREVRPTAWVVEGGGTGCGGRVINVK